MAQGGADMAVDKTKAMVAKRKRQSEKLLTEVKLLVDEYYKNDVPIKKSKVAEALHMSVSTLSHNKEMAAYIKKIQDKQAEKNPDGIDIHYRATAQYRKLMAAYIFTYQLLEEQNSILESQIQRMEEKLKRLQDANNQK